MKPALRTGKELFHRVRRLFNRMQIPSFWFSCLPQTPVSRRFAFDRGKPIDRYLMELFLQCNHSDIRGRVLEVGDREYTQRFGGNAVTKSAVLHAVEGNPIATVIGDLATGKGLRKAHYDCIILTQTLHVIYDVHSAVRTLYGLLKAGGVALVTIPGISQISRYDDERWGDYWRMTPTSARRLFEEAFPSEDILVTAYGNVRLATAFLYGLAIEDIPSSALDVVDPDFPMLICVRAIRK